ncbi:GRAM domain-containing protein [Thioalkalivibrio thiocyanodenitrificans]|uniref:GRAM domain-containing protein n=1 Tax=Thioalkalivibrio thiocyanodenitrificans TaxID=243063 RepID=UPI0018DC3289|nr:GRAM domain-containing protein [Thioalkalivibrio thiocyanodenitrificans]
MSKHFDLSDGEKLLAEGLASHLKSVLSTDSGYCYLTNKRLVFCKKQMALSTLASPLIGPLVSAFRKQTRITFEVPLKNIKSIERNKHGFSYKDSLHLDSDQTINLQLQDEFVKCIEDMDIPVTVKR